MALLSAMAMPTAQVGTIKLEQACLIKMDIQQLEILSLLTTTLIIMVEVWQIQMVACLQLKMSYSAITVQHNIMVAVYITITVIPP